jgi:drug/metabolite transporter (DMT)-like permease
MVLLAKATFWHRVWLALAGGTGTRQSCCMRLALLTALTMIAFAGNSLLNRFAVADAGMDPTSFALIRVLAGAATLLILLGARGVGRGAFGVPLIGPAALPGVAGLSLYLAGFSQAYMGLGAGVGALILFGTVQITMFAGAVIRGQTLLPRRLVGAGVAFLGLLVLLWPASAPLSALPVLAMVAAGIGWGIYSLAGSADPLAGTTVNFVLASPVMALVWWGMGAAPVLSPGVGLAILSGAVTSGLGYALWYAILPGLGAQRAAVAQLTVPVIAAAGGAVLLAEGMGWRFVLAAVLVLGGVGLSSLSGAAKVKNQLPEKI